jgi:hypothetical protein
VRYALDAEVIIQTRQGVDLTSVRSIDDTSFDRACEIWDGYDLLVVPNAIFSQVASYMDELINAHNLELPEHEYVFARKFVVRRVPEDFDTAFEHDEGELTEAERDDLLSD